MLVHEVMRIPAVTVNSGAPLEVAISLMERHDVSAMPVINATGHLVGVLSEADVIRELTIPDQRTRGIPDWIIPTIRASHVSEVMTTQPVTVEPDADLGVATELMTNLGIRSVPVVDRDRVVGVVSRRDVIRMLAKART
jgi:CBS domain-containing protein